MSRAVAYGDTVSPQVELQIARFDVKWLLHALHQAYLADLQAVGAPVSEGRGRLRRREGGA